MRVFKSKGKIILKSFSFILIMLVITFVLGCTSAKSKDPTIFPVLNDRLANSYIIADNGEAAIVDPSDPDRVTSIINENDLKVRFIILTHGHFDHITGVDSLVDQFPGSQVLIHPADHGKLADPEKNVSTLFGANVKVKADKFSLTEKDVVKIGNTEIKVMETPGHTEGSIVLMVGSNLISGDTLFKGSVGRTDLPGSSNEALMGSLKKIMTLSDHLKVYPGHGEQTVLGEEKKTNPYLQNR